MRINKKVRENKGKKIMGMTKRFKLGLSIWIIFIFANSIHAQNLPLGKYQQIRERTIDIIHYKAELSFDFDER